MSGAQDATPIAHHISREADPAERGRAFGRSQRDAVRHTVAVYARIFDEDLGLDENAVQTRGDRVETVVRAFRPALCAELEGVAAGAGVSPGLLYAVNARTELLSGGRLSGAIGGECSTVGICAADGTRGVLGQTWDFHPALAPSRVLWTRCLAGGEWFTTFTEAGVLAKVGVSSRGMALAMNFLSTDRDGGNDGIPVHVLVRTVLEEAATVEQARELIETAPASASACLTIAGPSASGGVDVIALERWPGGVGVHTGTPRAGSLAHTNHFLAPIAALDAMRAGRGGTSTELRYEHLRSALAAGVTPDVSSVSRLLSWESPVDPQASILQRGQENDIRPWLERYATLATVVMEVPSARLWLRRDADPALAPEPVPAPR